MTRSRSTWACELKFRNFLSKPVGQASRSTWACELKLLCPYRLSLRDRSRSTWACELKWRIGRSLRCYRRVTLHVSVWVEIFGLINALVSTIPVTLHVSVWVEIHLFCQRLNRLSSRSTWACELKCPKLSLLWRFLRHAPRERVSWNSDDGLLVCAVIVTLHVSVWVEIFLPNANKIVRCVTLHVSVWVEIAMCPTCGIFILCHAPRERVSWNVHAVRAFQHTSVTLHVSVWVEIDDWDLTVNTVRSRSTWACELKLSVRQKYFKTYWSRSTWACELKFSVPFVIVTVCSHAPRERVSWNT